VEACTVETGLLRKAPCGHTAVAKCANCEQPLCSKHAIAQLSAGRKTGKFLCADCNAADRQYQATTPAAPPAAKPVAPAKPPAAAATPAPSAGPGNPPAAPAKPPAQKPLEENSDGSIDFTPSKK
jgi:hypothetical protein